MSVIKKGSGYMTLNLKNKNYLEVSFKDVRHYTSPCNLDKFLKTWQAPAEKSIFPYQKYSSIEELEQATDFPSLEDFYSDLKQVRLLTQNFNNKLFSKHVIKNLMMKLSSYMILGKLYQTMIHRKCVI